MRAFFSDVARAHRRQNMTSGIVCTAALLKLGFLAAFASPAPWPVLAGAGVLALGLSAMSVVLAWKLSGILWGTRESVRLRIASPLLKEVRKAYQLSDEIAPVLYNYTVYEETLQFRRVMDLLEDLAGRAKDLLMPIAASPKPVEKEDLPPALHVLRQDLLQLNRAVEKWIAYGYSDDFKMPAEFLARYVSQGGGEAPRQG